jgi:hypothetical protein
VHSQFLLHVHSQVARAQSVLLARAHWRSDFCIVFHILMQYFYIFSMAFNQDSV